MSTEMIVVLIFVGLAALIGLFYISHAIEKQRRQRALLIANLSDYAFRMQRLLDFIPPAYISNDIRLLLLKQIKKRLERLVEISPQNDKYRKKLDSCNAQISDVGTGGAAPPPPQLKTPDEANELRALLQELSKVIEAFVQSKVISANEAQKHLQALQKSFIEASVNYYLQLGQTAQQEKKAKLAIHYYQKALAELVKRNKNGVYNTRIEQIKHQLSILQEEANTEQPQTASEGSSELNKGMDQLLEEEDAWKKKYF